MKPLLRIQRWIRRWWFKYLSSNPIPEKRLPDPEEPMLTDVEKLYEVIEYGGQRINLHKHVEKPKFEKMSREQKRKLREHWRRMEKKGIIKFIEVNGKLICVKNKNYEPRAEASRQDDIQ